MPTDTPQRYELQAEIKQLLDIVVHSLYTANEIFVRELVSNASDALERFRYLRLSEQAVADDELPLQIDVTTDESAKTLIIQDSGIGMTRAELVENLGTIAHSGSKAFLQALGDADRKGTNLIGQFGVGFYSAFMVAKTVTVYSRSWRPDEPGHVWTSDGTGTFDVAEAPDLRRGVRIVLALKDDCVEFAQEWRIREILERYSAFVAFPIALNGARINTVQALWLRGRSEISDEEYAEFYRFQAHAYDEPRLRLHFTADAPLAINALLFVPADDPEKVGLVRAEPSVGLYARRVLIDGRPADLLPSWLRFLKGVVESEDLPLNISRESLQDRSLLAKLKKVVTTRFLRFLEEEAAQRPEAYDAFFAAFGRYLKEGAALDFAHRDQLAKLLRFESSRLEAGTTTTLADYVSRMGADQTEIYYIVRPSRRAIESSPYLEGLRARDVEVLFGYEPIDEYVMDHLHAYDGKTIVSADRADVKAPVAEHAEGALGEAERERLTTWLQATLGERVASVKASERLVDSPVLATDAAGTNGFVSAQMRRMQRMQRMQRVQRGGADADPVRVNLEINPRHRLIVHLSNTLATSPDAARLIAEQLFDNALLGAGLLDDTAAMVARLNELLQRVQ